MHTLVPTGGFIVVFIITRCVPSYGKYILHTVPTSAAAIVCIVKCVDGSVCAYTVLNTCIILVTITTTTTTERIAVLTGGVRRRRNIVCKRKENREMLAQYYTKHMI